MNLIPEPYKLLAELAVTAASLGGLWLLGHHQGVAAEHQRAAVQLADVQHRWDVERAQESAAAASASEADRVEEQRRLAAQQEVIRHAENQIAEARAAAGRAAAAAGGLRERAAAVAARCDRAPSDTAAASPGPAASDPGVLLADVLGRLEESGRRLAQIADERGAAGAACEASYDALKPPAGAQPAR
jgi:hypothetical protein